MEQAGEFTGLNQRGRWMGLEYTRCVGVRQGSRSRWCRPHSRSLAQFFYLALQESNFDAYTSGPPTRSGIAKGMCQFVPPTAMKYGLRIGPLADQPAPIWLTTAIIGIEIAPPGRGQLSVRSLHHRLAGFRVPGDVLL